jgi:hypothetical protein
MTLDLYIEETEYGLLGNIDVAEFSFTTKGQTEEEVITAMREKIDEYTEYDALGSDWFWIDARDVAFNIIRD